MQGLISSRNISDDTKDETGSKIKHFITQSLPQIHLF